MTYTYTPKGVCSRQMKVDVEDGIIRSVEILGGCSGNLQGISRLIEGMPVEVAIQKMEGVKCGYKDTSCPDQLSIALREAMKKQAEPCHTKSPPEKILRPAFCIDSSAVYSPIC